MHSLKAYDCETYVQAGNTNGKVIMIYFGCILHPAL